MSMWSERANSNFVPATHASQATTKINGSLVIRIQLELIISILDFRNSVEVKSIFNFIAYEEYGQC
jgi:hypothetical protein